MSSNHQLTIIKQATQSINCRLTDNSSNETKFNEAKRNYETVQWVFNGHTYTTQQKKLTEERSYGLIHCTVKIKTNVGKQFIKLIHRHIPPSSTFYKMFNRNILKISFSYTHNVILLKIQQKINNKCLTSTKHPCNCKVMHKCLLNGNCLQSNIIYQAILKTK